jgi:hypothetical protein
MSGDVDRRTVISVAVALVAVIAIVAVGIAAAGGGGDDGESSTSPAPAAAPSDGAAPPGVLSGFPPEFIQCLADQGVDIQSLEGIDPQEIFHGGAVPPEVMNACFGVIHGGGGAP